jgi:predicted nucleic acid-binding protein
MVRQLAEWGAAVRACQPHHQEQAEAYAAEVREAEVDYTWAERWLLAAVWEIRHNVSPYDAPYVALARRNDIPLVTFDERLARAARSLGADVLVPKW